MKIKIETAYENHAEEGISRSFARWLDGPYEGKLGDYWIHNKEEWTGKSSEFFRGLRGKVFEVEIEDLEQWYDKELGELVHTPDTTQTGGRLKVINSIKESVESGLTAVIIKGNPKRITKETYGGIYEGLKSLLEDMGIKTVIDEGKPYSTPKNADIWIGHSRGVDRLRFAPEGTLAIKIGSHDEDALNHPGEVTSGNPSDYDSLTDEEKNKHLTLHPSVSEGIKEKINNWRRDRVMEESLRNDPLYRDWELLLLESRTQYTKHQLANASMLHPEVIRKALAKGLLEPVGGHGLSPMFGPHAIDVAKAIKSYIDEFSANSDDAIEAVSHDPELFPE